MNLEWQSLSLIEAFFMGNDDHDVFADVGFIISF